MSASHAPSLAATMLALGALACGSTGDAPTGAKAVAFTTYEGVFATGTQSGIVQLVSGSPATGSLRVTGGMSIPLLGNYDASASTFSVSGSGYVLRATVDANRQVAGTLSGSGASTSGVVAAVALTQGTTPLKVCGTYTGTSAGRLNAVISGTTIAALTVDAAGIGLNLTGSVSGNNVTFGWRPMGSSGGVGSGTATGTIAGTSASGTWSLSTGDHGTWAAAGC